MLFPTFTSMSDATKMRKMFDDPRFIPVNDTEGKLARVRIKRGTRFRPGDAVGTINRMYHVHMNIGPPGGEINPLSLRADWI